MLPAGTEAGGKGSGSGSAAIFRVASPTAASRHSRFPGRQVRGRPVCGDLGDEAVTLTNHSLNKARVAGIVTQDVAQLVNCCVNAVLGILESILAPKPAVYNFPADKLALTLEQQDEQLHRYALELERMAGAA